MTTLNMTGKQFATQIARDGIVLIDCWASWCSACAPFTPIFERVARNHPHHTFAKIDADREADLISQLGIDHIPSLMLYRDGILLFRQGGSFTEAQLEDIIRQAETVDMDDVRAHLAKQKGEQKPEKEGAKT